MAKKLANLTEEMYQLCNDYNKQIIEEFIDNSDELSPQTKPQYRSSLRIWINYIREFCKNKPLYEVESIDYKKFQSWLYNNGLGESAIRFKRASVSTLNNYIMLYYQKQYPTFRNFVNKGIKVPSLGEVNEKKPLTPTEYLHLCDELEKLGEWEKLAYLKFTYSTGCRRTESSLLLKEVVNYKPKIGKSKVKDDQGNETEIEVTSYRTHDIRCKGKGVVGKVRKLQFSEEAMEALKNWLEFRGEDDCPYMFVIKDKNGAHGRPPENFNYWCKKLFASIVGRRVHPHLFRESRATNLVLHSGKDLETAQKLLGHKSVETTKIYVIREDTDDADDAFTD
ncbi:tyrosine-type recombinase/integrase [Clostridium sp. FP2]|uniref:tyrosine-type recombinase/integrase n=1 Tax=Clostridium sp. FP2 TaxID=2724481 RepID=UPI0013E8FC67|nr:tyrosine-type recombinase/integrase [Clostridium sp. FP2]MBZ9622830.1 tyrosine-type recombinase/integrase [Clostridium sp. FP2]